jgi:aspartyl/glutamyl-tRNA(Asn/Gln) amidotransferase C subunit
MALTIDQVRNIATLSRLWLSPEEEEGMVAQLGRIVDYVGQLRAYDVPPAEPGGESVREAEDVPRAGLPSELFLANAPAILGRFLVVPEVKGGSGSGA